MRALVFEGPWRMPLRERPEPQPGPEDAVVAVRAVGVCGSDVHGYTGSTGRRRPGVVMGHELSGEVVAVGERVSTVGSGDRVAVNPLVACGACEPCRSGRPNVCENRLGIGWSVDGGFADLVRAPARNLVPLPENLPFETAALAEPLAVSLRAANLTPLELGSTCAVLGAGPIGLLALLALKLKGAGRVVVADLSPRRLELARQLGADTVVNASEVDSVTAVRDLTGGRGADAVIEAVGASATAGASVEMVCNGGHVTWVGNSAPRVELSMQNLVTREVTVRGSYGFASEFARAVELLAAGRVDPGLLIERVAPLDEGPELVDGLAAGRLDLAKVILRP